MKAVMLSLRPQWCEKIFNGSKTIEVRKSRPSLDMPFKVYVYMTKRKWIFKLLPFLKNRFAKVVGEFVCDRIEEYTFSGYNARYRINDVDLAKTCLNHPELIAYGKSKYLYGWHITEPTLFEKPRDITEFALYGKCAEDCDEYDICARDSEDGRMSCKFFKRTFLKRPPMSWYYIEADEN